MSNLEHHFENLLFDGHDVAEQNGRTCKTCAVICQRLGCDIPACPSYEPFEEETS